jgi:hypothetical protein
MKGKEISLGSSTSENSEKDGHMSETLITRRNLRSRCFPTAPHHHGRELSHLSLSYWQFRLPLDCSGVDSRGVDSTVRSTS